MVGKNIACKNCSQTFLIKGVSQTLQLRDICKVALFEKMVRREQVDYAVASYQLLKRAGSTLKFDHFFKSCGLFDASQRRRLEELMENLELRRLGCRFCTIAVKRGLITQEIADQALEKQARQFKEHQAMELVGDILVNCGHITPEEQHQILVQQKRLSEDLISGENMESQGDAAMESEGDAADPSKTPLQQDIEPEQKGSHDAQTTDVEEQSIDENPPFSQKNEDSMASVQSETVENSNDPDDANRSDMQGEQDALEPNPSEPAEDPAFSIRVTENKLQAFLEINLVKARSITLTEVKAAISDAGIVQGVCDDGVILHFVEMAQDEPDTSPTSLLIAEGVPADKGKNAELNCFFDTDYLKAGAEKEDGSIDFMDRGERPFVSKGELLAKKIPMLPSAHGIDLYGEIIEVDPVHDIPLRCGKGALFSEDKLSVTADEDGEPHLSFDGKISVLSEQHIAGNIGLKTGHVTFDGNVVVSNIVKSGAEVRCANLSAAAVEDAKIETTGDIRISGGMTGAVIRTQGRVFAKFISKCIIDAYGDVTAEKEIIDSTIKTNGTCRVILGNLISSEVKAKEGVESVGVGTETSPPCNLHVGCEEHLEGEIASIQDQLSQLKSEMAEATQRGNQLKREKDELEKKTVSLAHVQDRGQLEKKGLEDRLDRLLQAITGEKKNDDMEERPDLSSLSFEAFCDWIDRVSTGETKQKAVEIMQQIQTLQGRVKAAESEIASCFEREDHVDAGLKAAQERFDDAEKRIRILEYQKETLKKRFKKEKGREEVIVRKVIYSGTVIHGRHCRWVVDAPLKNVTLKEVIHRSEKGSPERWEILVRQNG